MSTTDSREAFLEWKRDEGDIPNYIPDATIMASGYSDFELKAWQAALAWQAAKATGTAGEPVAYLRFRAAQQWSGIGGHDIEYNEWLETCHAHEVGDDGKPAFPVFDGPALLHADSDIFDLIREWAALPEGKRHDAARAIIGSVNRSYSAGVADGKVLGEAARQPAPVLSDAQIIEIYLHSFNSMPGALRQARPPEGSMKDTIVAFARAILAAANRSQP